MAEVIRMPRLSDTMEEGNIVAWLKKVGDKVSPGDILAEVETDKATMELESFYEGYLLYISVESGPVPVNDILAVIGEKNEDYKSLISDANESNGKDLPEEKTDSGTSPDEAKENKKETVTSESTPKEESKEKRPKQEKKEKQPKEETEEESPEGETKEAQPEEETSETPTNEAQPTLPSESLTTSGQRIKSSPLAKSIAAEAGVDLAGLKGTGDGGRIVKKDVERFVARGEKHAEQSKTQTTHQYGDIPLSQMRKTIAKRLVESKFGAPHFYLTMKINMDKTSDARKLINDTSGLKISFNDFVVKACAASLKMHPAINASWLGDKIRVNKDINIGIAVAVDEGLLVPVLFGAERLGLGEINNQIAVMADKARGKKLQPQEMQGNTFTVSNLGMFGIDEFTAIINPPDSAILAIGTISDELNLIDGKVSSSKIMKVTLSCDHRVIDGATGAKFLQTFKQLLENPVSMLV